MDFPFTKSQLALAAVAALGATALSGMPTPATAAKVPGKYVAGDIHNHTTCSDGTISMQKLVKKATDRTDTPWGLDWFVQAGHGGNGNRNCTLAEDATLSTPAYPVTSQGPTTTWQNSGVTPKGDILGNHTQPRHVALAVGAGIPVSVARVPRGLHRSSAVHRRRVGWWPVTEHTSASVITGQMPVSLDTATLPTTAGYNALGNATAMAQWEYCFDRGDSDTSRGNSTGTNVGNNWNCAVTGSANAADVSWNPTAQKLIPAGGAGTGDRGHLKTVEAMKWMKEFHPSGSYYLPTHLERAGPFNPGGNNGFNIEHLRNFNNAAPDVAFGFETQPGHGASGERGEYTIRRNNIGGVNTDSVGGYHLRRYRRLWRADRRRVGRDAGRRSQLLVHRELRLA